MSRAALLTRLEAPLEIKHIANTGLDYGQVLVEVICSGICGAQLQEIDGLKKTGPLPHPMGHEGCGTVLDVGVGVTMVKVGDRVIMHWRKGEGIESNFPAYTVGFKQERITGGRVTTFGEQLVVSENRVTKVDPDVDPEFCALLGCSLSTALGTMENEANLRFGESVLVVGCGGLGLNLLLAAQMRQAVNITAWDIIEGKRALAMEMGAQDFRLPGRYPERYDVIINTTPSVESIQSSLVNLAPGGRYVLVGQPPQGAALQVDNVRHFFEGSGKRLLATQGGSFNPTQDIPRYIAMYHNFRFLGADDARLSKFNPGRFVSHRFPLDDINAGISAVRHGLAGRVMIHMKS